MPASAPIPGNALPIDVVSDVVCPWCFIGKRRLEKAIALKPEIPVTVRYRPYFLNPWVPRAGISRTEYLTTKFGSVDRYKANAQRIVTAARQDGLVYNLDAIARQPNTLDCHRLIRWSGESGDPARMKQRLMELYFTEGADLSDNEVLVGAARDCGMDADHVRRRLASEEDVELISAEAEVRQDRRHRRRPLLHPGRHLRGVGRAGAGISRRRHRTRRRGARQARTRGNRAGVRRARDKVTSIANPWPQLAGLRGVV